MTLEGSLAEGVRAAWSSISSKMLDNLESSMLQSASLAGQDQGKVGYTILV